MTFPTFSLTVSMSYEPPSTHLWPWLWSLQWLG